jgi:hypothetical protein
VRITNDKPSREIAARVGEVAAIVQPAQFLYAVVVAPARHVVEGVAQEPHIAALIGRLGQNLAQRHPQPAWSSATTNSTPSRPCAFSASRKSRRLDRLSRSASSTASTPAFAGAGSGAGRPTRCMTWRRLMTTAGARGEDKIDVVVV